MTIYDQLALLKRLRDEFQTTLDYERILAAQFRRFLTSESVVLDIGANVGDHTATFLSLIKPPGKVLAFEPIPSVFENLKSRFVGEEDVLQLYQIALGNQDGESSFVFATGCPPESGLRQRIYNAPETALPVEIRVPVRRLDGIAQSLHRIDYMKLDTEGGELDILQGARETIKRCRPIISAEYGYAGYSVYGYQRATLFDLCEEFDYTLVDLFGNAVDDKAMWDRVCDQVYWDYFCVPSERVGWITSLLGPPRAVQGR